MAAVVLALIGVSGAARAADSLFTWDGNKTQALKIYHAYSASDGLTHVEEITVPAQMRASPAGAALVYFDLKPEALRIAQSDTGELSGWHYAGDSKHLIIPMQGDIDFDIGDGKIYHVKAGEAILAEDWAGKGHRSGCDAVNKQFCVVFDILVGPNPKALPLEPPPK